MPPGLNRPEPEDANTGGMQKALLDFAKMQGIGNDFVVVAESDLACASLAAGLGADWRKQAARLARAICNRHYGVGADGLIVAGASPTPDCALGWMYVNGDGSPSDMCGNGMRCLGLWARERGLIESNAFSVATARGPVAVSIVDADHITIDLGEPILASIEIPVSGKPRERVVGEPIEVHGWTLKATMVSMGNPHCVIFNPHVDPAEYLELAPEIQALPLFPEGVNVEFALTRGPRNAKVFVWERGCGPTLACATGAAAVLVAGVLEERLEPKADIELPGGVLSVEWASSDNHVRLTGPAREMFRGTIDLSHLLAET